MEKVKTGRKYVIDGLGPASKSFEKRQVRSATVQAVRDFINENWVLSEDGQTMRLEVTIKALGVDGGGRLVTAEVKGMVWENSSS
jgi:phage terminase large subunit GpA-like protein